MEKIFIITIAFIKSVLSGLKILLRSKYITYLPKSEKKKCLIIGNGPSAKNDMAILLNHKIEADLLCLNKFPDTEYYELLKPRHFIIVSTEFWKKGSIEKYNIFRDNIIKAFIKKTSWPINFLLPAEARHNPTFIRQFETNKFINLVYFNTTPVEGLKIFSHLFFNLNLGSPRPHNVLIPSILTTIWMKYKEIGIIGADHSWLETLTVNEHNDALLNQKHFYDTQFDAAQKMTKRGSDYRKLHEILEQFTLTFKAYFTLDDYAKSKGIKLYNCSSKSYIDGLERMPLEEFINVTLYFQEK